MLFLSDVTKISLYVFENKKSEAEPRF